MHSDFFLMPLDRIGFSDWKFFFLVMKIAFEKPV